MKKIKKLTLKKEVISILAGNEMNQLKGGVDANCTRNDYCSKDSCTEDILDDYDDSSSCDDFCNNADTGKLY